MAEVSTWLEVQGYFSLSHSVLRSGIKVPNSSAEAGLGSEGGRGSPTVDNDKTLGVVVGHGIQHLVNARDRNGFLHESIRS